MVVAFRPCIDIHDGVVKQIVGSSLRDAQPRAGDALQPRDAAADAATSTVVTNFVSALPAAHFAEVYRRDGLRGGHVIMLGASSANAAAAKSALAAYPGGLQVGGGVTAANAADFIAAGASHVIVTSFVFRDGAVDLAALEALVRAVGRERVVLDLSCRKRPRQLPATGHEFVVVTDRWQRWTDTVVDAASLAHLGRYCAEFLVHGVDVEGLRWVQWLACEG